jgi:hypothetical protein
MIQHPWIFEGDKLGCIARHEMVEAIVGPFDNILLKMEQLGLPRAETEASLRVQDLNQLTTTYALLEFQSAKSLPLQCPMEPHDCKL